MNKKGFTLVELLAVVVILGILMTISIPAVSKWIDKGKATNLDSQKETLIMATKSYAQANRNNLPKAIGDHKTVTASELKQNNYLEKDIINGNKESCMAESKVEIYKISSNSYSYIGYVYCGKEKAVQTTLPNPTISISFDSVLDNNNNNQNLTNSHVTITINGGTDTDGSQLGIASYRYTIAYNNTSVAADKIELFNTEYIEAGGREEITIEKELRDYVDVNKLTNIFVSATAFNTAGGKATKTDNSTFKDTIGPTCGKITGQAGENEWLTAPNSIRKISVECIDRDGSGCVKDVYTKTFKTQMTNSVITIRDNNGNSTDCPVRVHLDWTSPTLTIKAYKRNASGGKEGNAIATSVAKNDSRTVNLKSYTNGHGTDSWLNAANYPYGIYLEVTTSDNIHLASGTYSENAKALKKGDAKIETLTQKTSNAGGGTTFSIVDEGWRRGNYVVKDTAGNTVTVKITAPIDRTKPVCGALTGQPGEEEWNKDWRSKTITVACSDTISNCTQNSYQKTFNTQMNTNTITIVDNANNSINCTTRVHLDWTTPTLNIKVYKRNSGGGKEGNAVANVTANDANRSVNLTSYTNGNGGDSWLNLANFPYGIYLEITTSDNYTLASGVYKENNAGIKKNGSGVNTLNQKTSNAGGGTAISIVDEGWRKGQYTVKDKAGNSVTINITAPIDRTKPNTVATKTATGSESGVTVSVTCTDTMSGCTGYSETIKASKTFNIHDNAGNPSVTSATINVEGYNCHPFSCNPHDCNCHDCNPHSCNCYSCGSYICGRNCTGEGGGYGQYGYGSVCLPVYCSNTCCGTCYDTCCDTCWDTCYKTCYR